MSARKQLTPHTFEYDEKTLNDGREVNWTPFLMFFHPAGHRSPVVNTDCAGFRYSHRGDLAYSVAEHTGVDSARLLVGSSTVFGIGASSDRWTLASRLSAHDARPAPWLNFGALAFNSAQELLLYTLHRHQLPRIDEIVLFTGFNNLVLARLPKDERHAHGAFFNCNRYFDMVQNAEAGTGGLRVLLGGLTQKPAPEVKPSRAEQLTIASELTLRHLDGWRLLAGAMGARLTFVLQPVALWVRERGCKEEEMLFAEFNQLGNFLDIYGDILTRHACLEYAERLQQGADRMGVNFINFSPLLAEVAKPDEWLFVDRIHFTDHGHDVVARLLLDLL
jgi:hypothetical protein